MVFASGENSSVPRMGVPRLLNIERSWCYLRQLGSGSSAAAVRLKARKMAGRCLSQHTLILAFEARTEPVLGAPSNASDAGPGSPSHCARKGAGSDFRRKKFGFWTYMRAFQFVESKLDSHWTKRSIADGASGVVRPTVILFAEEFTEKRSGQGWPLWSVRTSTTLIQE
jgi:hypothetical protein